MPSQSVATIPGERPPAGPALQREDYELYLPLVRRVALRTAQALPKHLTYDDVLRAGWAGLVAALGRRPGSSEEDFQSYAAYRVRQAVLEFLRAQDPASRQLREVSLRISAAIAELCAEHRRVPSEEEVAAHLGLNLEGYWALLQKVAEGGWARLELTTDGADGESEQMATKEQLTGRVERIIVGLPEQYQVVLGLYYQEKCDHREIADVLGVDEARACQIHTQAVHLIRGQLRGGVVS